MKYSNTIEYNISTKLDSSGLTKLQSQIKQLENSMQQMANRELLNSDKVQAAKTQLEGLNTALTNSFNSSLGILDLSKFRAELDAGKVSAQGLQSAFNMMGTEGQAALGGLTSQIANFNGGMERTSSAVDKIFTTFSNTFRWGMVSSFFSQFMNAIHSSIDYVKELDDSLTQIMLVTDYNRDSMNEFARSANEAAKAVSMTTTGMTNASLIFAQQGYNLNQSQELATLSAKVANASQQDTATTSDQITAYMNAYGLENSIGELTQAMDNWALIANVSAADVGELAKASQRAASMANAVGVSGEALAAQIATIESVTREAPEQIGNGLKTLYARFSDISLGGEDEDGVGLGKVTSILEGIGVKVLDEFGNIRTMDAIMEDLMVVWDDLDTTTKTAAAQALAGKYQVNRFEALMENSDMYREYKGATGENAAGTLDTMNEEYANSIAGRSAKMQASLEGLFSTVFNTDDIYPWMDTAQGAIDLLQQFFDALGGGKTILLGITTLLSQAFNQNIARNINDAIANRNLAKIREQNIATVSDTLDKAGIDRTQGVGKYITDTADQAKLGALSDAQYDNYMGNVKELEQSATALRNAEHEMTKDFDSYNMVMNKLGHRGDAAFHSEEGLNTSAGSEDVASNSKKKIQDFEIDFSDDIKQAQKLEEQLQEVRKALDELHEANKKGIGTDEAIGKVKEKAEEVKDTLKDLEEAAAARDRNENRTIFEVGDTPKEIETTIDSIEALSTEVEEEAREADKQLGQVEERIRTIHEEAVKFSSDPKATQAMALAGDQKLAGDQTAISGLEARKKAAEDMAAGSAQSIINQQQIKDVLDFVQGIQELTVAWQAFQNLGELWSNKDLLIGEKILQTIMNLAVVIPSVIDAYEKLSKVGSVIQTLGTLQEALAAKSIAATAATSGFSVANLALAASSKVAAGGVGILKAALEGLSSIPVVAAVGAIIVALQYLQSEFRKSQEAATESFNKYGEALSQTQIDTSGFDEAYQKYKETGVVSDELKDSALELTEALDITGGEAFVASGNFDALAKSIEEAKKESNDLAESMADKTLSRLDANSKKYVPFMQDTFSAETLAADNQGGIYYPGTEHIQDENLKLNYFDAFGRDISGMDFGEKIEDISKKSEIANKNLDNLIERKERLEKKDPAELTNDEQLFLQDIEEKIRKAQETVNVLESLLGREDVQQYQQITEQEKTRNLENLDNTISNDIENQQSIFNTGKYDEAKDYLLKQEGVDTSNVDILIEKYARLAENEELAAEAALKVRDQQIADNVGTGNFIKGPLEDGPFSMYEQKAGMLGRDQIDQLAENFGLSLKDKAKISDMIDWTDPAVDSKVEELVEKIQEGLEDGISLDNLLNSVDPERMTEALSEMKPVDPDIDEDSFQNLANYIHDNWENLEELNESLGESAQFLETDAEYIADVTEAILRYQDALDESAEKMEDWLEALDSNDLEERSNAINEIRDSMEDFLNLDAGSLSDDFVEAEDNMQLFQDALAGVDGAYNEFLEKALIDKFQLDVDNEPAMAALDDCLVALDNFDGYANTDFGPLTLDDSQAIAALENTINAFGMGEEAAKAFAKSMGYEIEVEPVDVQQEGQSQMTGWTPEIAGGVDLTAETFVAGPPLTGGAALAADLQGGGGIAPVNLTKGPPLSAHMDGVAFTPQTDQSNETKNTPLTQIKTKSGNGETSGGLKIKSLKRIAPTGAGKAKNSSRPSGGGGGGSCFVAGTLITTLFGFSPIEQIKQGDIVLSYNESFHQLEYSTVVQTMIHDVVEPIYTLYIKDEQLRVTGIHRFLISHDIFHSVPQWVPAADLQIGDWMFLADGTWHLIHNIEVSVEHQIVYNFEVAGNHNYYVGRNQILAHNKGGKSCFVAGTAISTSLGFKPIEIIKADDIVLSYNESLHQNEYSKVVQTMIHNTIEPIYTLYIKNEQLRVTGIHRFLISKDINFEPQWIAAQDLQIGDWVLLADGTWHLIWKIEINLEHQIVYNFEVSNNHNYYVGRNQILAHNKGGGGKGGKGGGGGGKAKTIENKEKKEHKKDYYEEVNNQLEKTEKVLSRIEKAEDRLIGDKARAKQNKQLDLLEKEINLQKERQKIQQQELKDVDELFKKKQKEARDLALKNDVRTFMPEVQYDEDGVISNYEEISKALDDMHNSLIDKYNNAAKAGNEDLTKEIDKTIKKFDDYSKEILDNAKRHNKLQSEIEETTNKLEELEDKIEDVRIDAYKAHQEAIDDLKDLREDAAEINAVFRDYDENSFLNKPSIDKTPYTELLETFYKLDTIFNVSKEDATAFYDNLIAQEKKALDAADEYERLAIESSIAYFEEQKKKVTDEKTTNGLLGLALQDLEQLSAWRDNPDVASNPFGKNTAALSEAYEDAFKRVNDLRKQQEDLTRDARDNVLDLYDAIEDGIDRQLDGYDRLQDKLEQINDTYQLYYGEDSYENILKTMDQQSNTMQSQLDALKETYNYWVEQYQAALAVGDEKLIHEVEDRMNDAEEAMLDKAEELAEHFVDRYEKALDAGIQKMTNNLWGGGEGQMDLEDQSTMWELQKDYMDTYKDDVEKAYEIDKLRSKYIGLLNDAQGMSLQTQNKIRGQMQEQLDLLQNQKTVSEYDVKLANAKLEILQKQIALEDAQRNKNKMQLRRDTQGNYRYVYTAEQGDVQQAQDELNESQYNAYEMTKEQTIANNDRAVNLYQDYMNKIRDIANKYKDDEGARVAALAALNEEYKKLLGGLEEDFKDTTNGMYDVLTWMVENGTQDTTDAAVTMLDTLYDKNGQVKEDTGVAWRDLATQISNEVLPGIENEVIETFDTIENEADVLKDKLTGNNGALDLIGSAAKKMNSSLQEAAKTTENLAAQTEKLFSALGSDEGALKKALDKVHEYSEGLTNAQKRTDILGSSLNKATEDLQAEKSKNLNYKTLIDLKNGIGKFERGQKYTIRKGTRIFYDRDGATQTDESGSKSYVVPEDVEVKVRTDYLTSAFGPGLAKYPVTIYPTNEDKWGKHLPDTDGEEGIRTRQQQDWHIGITEFRDALKYDTGGYTGEWNEATSLWKNGKMAMLHQKELVLNSTDTENILSAVQLIRQLVSSNNNSLNTLKFNSNNANSMLPNSTIEQRVEIQATFPNATDADDIRTALLGLSDKAFQYAHRRI